MEEKNNLKEIPEIFLSYDTNEPFTHCLLCDISLTDGATDYFVEKAYKQHLSHSVTDVVFEYAMCLKCIQKTQQSMSKESLLQIQLYFSSQTSFIEKAAAHHRGEGSNIELDKCNITGQSIETLSEYMICGHFRGNKMVSTTMPYLLSGVVLDELTSVLSNETLDIMDDFMGKHFVGPPELEEIWKRKPVFL